MQIESNQQHEPFFRSFRKQKQLHNQKQQDPKDNNDSTNNSTCIINQSIFGKGMQDLGGLTKKDLTQIINSNEQEVTSRHGFFKYLKLRGSIVKDSYFSLDQFNQILNNESDNEFNVILDSYQRAFWQPAFRQALINAINSGLSNQKSIVSFSLKQTLFHLNSKKFVVQKGINIMKSFQVNAALLETVRALRYKTETDKPVPKISEIFKNLDKIDELSSKYSKICKKYMNDVQKQKSNNSDLIKGLFYKFQKTQFKMQKKDQQQPNFPSSKMMHQIRRQNELKLLVIKFHCRMMREFYLNLSYYRIYLGQKSQYSFTKLQQRIFKQNRNIHKPPQTEPEESQKIDWQNLNEYEKIIAMIGKTKSKLSQFEGDIITIAYMNTAISQFKEIFPLFKLPKDQRVVFLKFQTKMQQALMYLESAIVTEIRYIKATKQIPKQYQQSIQFLIDLDQLVNFIINISSIVSQKIQENQRISLQNSEAQVFKYIKKFIPQIQIMLSYGNMTSYFLNQILDKYFLDPRQTLNKLEVQNLIIKKQQLQKTGNPYLDGTVNLQKWVKKIYQHMALYNFVIISYQFSQLTPFNLLYFYLKQSSQNYQCLKVLTPNQDTKNYYQRMKPNSKTLMKLYFFWKTFDRPQLLKRIYQSCSLRKHETRQLIKTKQFSFHLIFKKFVDYNQINQYKVKYLVHFSQFFLEIISDLISLENISLSAVFNVSRFLILNFVCFFYVQSIKRIEQQIKHKHGDFYHAILKNQMKNNKRITDNMGKLNDAIKLSADRIQKYLNQLQKSKNKAGSNAHKLQKIFNDFPQIQNLFFYLNTQKINQNKLIWKDPAKTQDMKYDFDIVRKCYLSILKLLIKDYISKQVLERILKKITPITEEQDHLIKPNNLGVKQFLHLCNKQFQPLLKADEKLNLFLNNKGYDSNEVYQTYFQKFIISFLQMSKLSVMIICMPYYSYQNQLEYVRKKTFNKQSLKKCYKVIPKNRILYNLDKLYISERNRISLSFIKLNMKNFKLFPIFTAFLQQVNQIFQFLNLSQPIEKKIINFKNEHTLNIEEQMIHYPKKLHTQYLSIYSKLELESFFLSFNRSEGNSQFRLSEIYCRGLEQFFKTCKTMQVRSKNVWKEVKKKHQIGNYNGLDKIEENDSSDKEDQIKEQIDKQKSLQATRDRTTETTTYKK